MMAAVTWSGDRADWQLNEGVGRALQRIRGASEEAPLDVVPEHARRLGGLLPPVRYKWKVKPTTKGLADQKLVRPANVSC